MVAHQNHPASQHGWSPSRLSPRIRPKILAHALPVLLQKISERLDLDFGQSVGKMLSDDEHLDPDD